MGGPVAGGLPSGLLGRCTGCRQGCWLGLKAGSGALLYRHGRAGAKGRQPRWQISRTRPQHDGQGQRGVTTPAQQGGGGLAAFSPAQQLSQRQTGVALAFQLGGEGHGQQQGRAGAGAGAVGGDEARQRSVQPAQPAMLSPGVQRGEQGQRLRRDGQAGITRAGRAGPIGSVNNGMSNNGMGNNISGTRAAAGKEGGHDVEVSLLARAWSSAASRAASGAT